LDEFGIHFKDEYGVTLALHSNHGKDKKRYLEYAKKLERPILLQIEGEVFERYQFTNFALTVSEAKMLAKELMRMVDYLEGV
jgi:hypothetical protein